MAGLLYFFPQIEPAGLAVGGKINRDVLRDQDLLGSLADVIDHPADAMVSGVKKGPGDVPGSLLTPLTPASDSDKVQCLYKPEQQSWLPIGEGRFYLGWWTEKPPAVPELARRKQYAGYDVTDHHGRQWRIPVARSHNGTTCTLPTFHEYDPSSLNLRQSLAPEYAPLWEIAGRAFDHFTGNAAEGTPPPSTAELVQWAVQALAVNYRLGPAELAALAAAGINPLDHDTVGNVLIALSDLAVFDTTVKNLPAGIAPSVPASTNSTSTAKAAGGSPSAAAN